MALSVGMRYKNPELLLGSCDLGIGHNAAPSSDASTTLWSVSDRESAVPAAGLPS